MRFSWKKMLQRLVGRRRTVEIDPHEVLLDASNLPAYNESQFEGRIERPISKQTLRVVSAVFVIVAVIFAGRLWLLQVELGAVYAAQSEENRLRQTVLFADRGVIYDRSGVELAWNDPNETDSFARRAYYAEPGFSHLIGYIGYPERDAAGFFYRDAYVGKDGVERFYGKTVSGRNGIELVETNALGVVQSASVVRPPRHGDDLVLTIDADLQAKLYELIQTTAEDVGFAGGAGVIMDVESGELLALTSYPEYDQDTLSDGESREDIQKHVQDERKPFLNRTVAGLYTPGSIVKPFVAAGVLEEEIIDPEKEIVSTGSIRLPNPYFPGQYSVFTDWRAHGAVDLRHALAVSSNVYFYHVGGGFGDQQGLGIRSMGEYMRMFGFGEETGFALAPEGEGLVPSPEWKEATFDGEPWRIGDTYNTVIGQYGFQVTPLQVVRAVSALANGGALLQPTVIEGGRTEQGVVDVSKEHLAIVREGMRLAVTEGTAVGLNTPAVTIAAKTGTAELGAAKDFVNAWATGFFPYEHPRYAFVVVMERGPRSNVIGGVSVMRRLFDWMRNNTPQYFSEPVVQSG